MKRFSEIYLKKNQEKLSDKGLKTVSMFSFKSKLFKVMGSVALSPLSVRNSETCFSMINLFGFILGNAFHFEIRLYDILESSYFFQVIFS